MLFIKKLLFGKTKIINTKAITGSSKPRVLVKKIIFVKFRVLSTVKGLNKKKIKKKGNKNYY